MSIRQKITLLIAGAGFLASLVFSIVVFLEMVEQPLKIIDSELKSTGEMAARMILAGQEKSKPSPGGLSFPGSDLYWLKIYDRNSKEILYQSHIAMLVDIPRAKPSSRFTVSAIVPRDQINLGQDRGNEVTFRFRTFSFTLDGRPLLLQIGRPSEKLEEEIWDTVIGIASGLAFSTMLLFAISYFIAGIILKPIGGISDLARDINEKSLDLRIPVRAGRDEFNELARIINRMFDRLQHSFARQKHLLADASHDLKTPLTMLRLSIDEVLSQNRQDLPDFLRESLLRQNVQVLRMERLVKNLLDLSSLEISEGIQFEQVDLTSLIESLLEDYRLLADTRSIRINVQVPANLTVKGDPEKITRALSNILDNSVKYNHDGGEIHLDAKKTGMTVELSITNTGTGIPESEIDKVFDQFYRVEGSRSHQYGGSGLGLAIVKRIIELHGGSVKMESKPGVWTKITILFPDKFAK
jgi:two-component system OmpR family sensor kinase